MDRNKKYREKIKKKGIIIWGPPANKSTGNGKLVYNMAKAFHEEGHNVFTLANEYNGIPLIHEGWLNVLPCFFCEYCGNAHKGDQLSVTKVAEWINQLNATQHIDYFIAVGDPYLIQQFGLGNIAFEKMPSVKSIMYATLDSERIFCNTALTNSGKRDPIKYFDKIISTSKFTQEQFKVWYDLDTDMIHETINIDNYSPVSKEKKLEIRKTHRFKENDFIMYYSGRNLMRKRHNILIEAAAKFICETEDTYLYLNIPPTSVNEDGTFNYVDPVNPLEFIKSTLKKKIGRDLIEEKRIIFVDRKGLGNGVSEQENANLYQLSDIYVCSTAGEGFGLVPIESISCEVPAIVPNNSTAQETIGIDDDGNGIGGILTDTPNEVYIDFNLKQNHTTVHHTYEAIVKLYNDPELRTKLGKQGREYVEKKFGFELFKNKWLKSIRNTDKKKNEISKKFKKLELNIKD